MWRGSRWNSSVCTCACFSSCCSSCEILANKVAKYFSLNCTMFNLRDCDFHNGKEVKWVLVVMSLWRVLLRSPGRKHMFSFSTLTIYSIGDNDLSDECVINIDIIIIIILNIDVYFTPACICNCTHVQHSTYSHIIVCLYPTYLNKTVCLLM